MFTIRQKDKTCIRLILGTEEYLLHSCFVTYSAKLRARFTTYANTCLRNNFELDGLRMNVLTSVTTSQFFTARLITSFTIAWLRAQTSASKVLTSVSTELKKSDFRQTSRYPCNLTSLHGAHGSPHFLLH